MQEDPAPLWGHLKGGPSESGILSLAQGSVLWPPAGHPGGLAEVQEGRGCLPQPLSLVVF